MRALIITDIQHDFMPGGALGIPGSNAIIPIVNRIIPRFDHVIAVMDWHPINHVSFASTHCKHPGDIIRIGEVEQILWPVHCVQNSHGAELADGLHRDKIEAVFHKGSDSKVDSYSSFYDAARRRSTGLADHLLKRKLSDLYFVGVATDYCVLYSVLDALDLGFRATVIRDACRAINRQAGDEERALFLMAQRGARIIDSGKI